MTTPPTAHSWTDVQPGYEYTPAVPLTGWRLSAALINGLVSPFINGAAAQAECGAVPAERRHDGHEVHPRCICGLYLCDTRQHLIDYWPDAATRFGRARTDIGSYRWGGVVVCQVTTASNVTGRCTWPGMTPPDSPHTYRAASLILRRVLVPTGAVPHLAKRIETKYPGVPVISMKGPLHTICKPEYAGLYR